MNPKPFWALKNLTVPVAINGLLIKRARRRFPIQTIRRGSVTSGFCVFLGEGRMAETARSSAIANFANLAIPHTYCNRRHTIAAARRYLLWYGRMKKDI